MNFVRNLTIVTFSLSSFAALGQGRAALSLHLEASLQPVFHQSLRDAELDRWLPRDEAQAQMLIAELTEEDVRQQSEASHIERLAKMVALQAYVIDALQGRSERASKEITERSSQLSSEIPSLARRLLRSSQSAQIQDRAVYLLALSQAQVNRLSDPSLKAFASRKLSTRDLRAYQDLVNYIQAINGGRNLSIGQARSGNQHGLSLLALSEALRLAHLNLSFKKLNKRAINQSALNKALSKAHAQLLSLPHEHDRLALERSLVKIWLSAQARSPNWLGFSIDHSKFGDRNLSQAILERQAMALVAKGEFGRAQKIYQALSDSFRGQSMMLIFDQKLIELHQRSFRKTKDPRSLDAALSQLMQKYLDSNALNDAAQSQKAHQRFLAMRQQLIFTELKRAQVPNMDRKTRLRAIAIAENFHAILEEQDKKEKIIEQIALTYAVSGQHSRAVDIYLDLALNGIESRRLHYLQSAASMQRTPAKWPQKAPWQGYGAGPASERQKLLDIHQRIHQAKADWPNLAHLGLIALSVQRSDVAFTAWTEGLDNLAPTMDAAQAAGVLMHAYRGTSEWAQMEKVTKITMKKKILPRYKGRLISQAEMLAMALFEGGKQLMAQKSFGDAATKLQEFSKVFKGDSRRPEAMYRLSWCFRSSKQFNEAMAAMKDYVSSYPQDKFAKDAHFHGGFWASEHGMEEDTIFYHQSFLSKYHGDARRLEVAENLLIIYEGRGLYAQANRIHASLLRQNNLSSERRLQAGRAVLENESRYGDPQRAIRFAREMTKMAPDSSEYAGTAYLYMAEAYKDAEMMSALQQLGRELESKHDRNYYADEALGLVRFVAADGYAAQAAPEIFNLELRDPRQTLRTQDQSFAKIQRQYQNVCNAGETSYCAAAHFRIARLAERMLDTIEEIQIVETLSNKVVAEFKSAKESSVSSLTQAMIQHDEKALNLSNKGLGSPNWTQEIYWANNPDWSFNEAKEKTGHGYMQFQPVRFEASGDDL